MSRPTRTGLLIGLVLLYAASFRLLSLDRPFEYDDEATGSFYGVLARNYLRFRLSETRGIPVETVGRAPDGTIAFYPDHPPLVPWLIAPLYILFTVGEWQTRLPTAIATVAAIYALYRLLRRRGSERVALTAAALLAAMPMTLYFGGMPEVVGMLLVLCAIVVVGAYLALHDRPGVLRALNMIAAFTLAALTDWPAFVLVPVLCVHWIATAPRRQWGWIVAFGAAAAALFAALYVYIAWAAHLPWSWMMPLLRHRTGLGLAPPFNAREWLATAWAFNRHVHTLPVLVAAGAWLATDAFRIVDANDARTVRARTAARLLLAWGAVHVLIGRQGVFNHEWWWSPLTPGLAAAGALLLDRALTFGEDRGFGRAALIASVGLVVAFGSWTTIGSCRALFTKRSLPFTTIDLGAAIRAAAPDANDVAVLVWSGSDPQVWFYGDRPVRANVWSVGDLERRIDADTVDLVFDDVQRWSAPAAGVVFPVMYRERMQKLYSYLRGRYPLAERNPVPGVFDVFDLRRRRTP